MNFKFVLIVLFMCFTLLLLRSPNAFATSSRNPLMINNTSVEEIFCLQNTNGLSSCYANIDTNMKDTAGKPISGVFNSPNYYFSVVDAGDTLLKQNSDSNDFITYTLDAKGVQLSLFGTEITRINTLASQGKYDFIYNDNGVKSTIRINVCTVNKVAGCGDLSQPHLKLAGPLVNSGGDGAKFNYISNFYDFDPLFTQGFGGSCSAFPPQNSPSPISWSIGSSLFKYSPLSDPINGRYNLYAFDYTTLGLSVGLYSNNGRIDPKSSFINLPPVPESITGNIQVLKYIRERISPLNLVIKCRYNINKLGTAVITLETVNTCKLGTIRRSSYKNIKDINGLTGEILELTCDRFRWK